MKTIRRYTNAADAGYDLSLIEAAGLTGIVTEDLTPRVGSNVASPAILLKVQDPDAQRAIDILNADANPDSQPAAILPDAPDPIQNSTSSPTLPQSQTFVVKCPECATKWKLDPQESRQRTFLCTECNTAFPILNISALAGGWIGNGTYPQPDWDLLRNYVNQYFSPSEHPLLWLQLALQWTRAIRDVLGPAYIIYESKNFILLTAKPSDTARSLLNDCEEILIHIRTFLGSLAWHWANGKHLILMFDDLELYYGYVAWFYPEEGQFASSGGMFLNRGYCHTVLPPTQYPVRALVHELTHLSLVRLRIPRWLNEGLAVTTEDAVNGKNSIRWDAELAASHKSHWNTETIQDFWSGKSFLDPASSHVSYSLAQILVTNIREDYGNLEDFIKNAKIPDAGDSSAQAHLGATLSEIASSFLGPGDRTPRLLST